MATKHAKGRVTLHHGDCLDVIRGLADNSIDSIVTDPPYGLNFMGKHWDDGAIAFNVVLWKECLRVLKPGGHLVAFGGTRTWHRLAVAIEDAGFEIRDNLAWLYGSGFPKSLDVGKAIDKAAGAKREVVGISPHSANREADMGYNGTGHSEGLRTLTAPATDAAKQWTGWGTALKPAFEPIVLARKPLAGTVAATVLEHGTGALNIDACRVGTDSRTNRGMASLGVMHVGNWKPREVSNTVAGRWPANVLLDDHAAALVDEQSGVSASSLRIDDLQGGGHTTRRSDFFSRGQSETEVVRTYGDSGGASRFFPVFKYNAKAPTKERPDVDGVRHPTVKPLALMQWLVRLVTPPNGTVLEPFAGSGTTVEACLREGVRVIAIEREDEYLPLIKARIKRSA